MTNRVYVVRPLCPSIPYIKSKVGRNGNHHIIAFCNFRWPLLCSCSLVHFSGYKYVSVGTASRILCFVWQPSQKQPWPVSSTSPVGLFLLSEHAWPTRVTPLLISCRKFVWSSVRVVCAAFISTFDVPTGILFERSEFLIDTSRKKNMCVLRVRLLILV